MPRSPHPQARYLTLLKALSYRLELTWFSSAQGAGCQLQLDALVPLQPLPCSG